MFTINIYLRFALIGLFLIGGVALAFMYGFWYAFPLILIGLTLFVGYVLMGTVQSTAQFIQETRFAEAERRLNLTLSPKLLYTGNRAYYYLIKGILAMQRNDTDEGERLFELAQETGLAGDNEKAMVQLQLANLSANRGKWKQAKNQFRQLKGLKVTEPQLKEQIREFEKVIGNRGAMRAAQQSGRGFRPGGKRSRPKIR